MSAIRPAIRSAIQPAIRSAFAGSYGWLPTSLFAAGEQGVWYDPSDLSTMFQDVAGTVPVTADGQLVARINDKSGNGKHATQATAASRPLYKTSGGLHWLQFDGVDDSLATAAIDYASNGKLSSFVGVLPTSWSSTYRSVFNNGGNSSADSGKFLLSVPSVANGATFYAASTNGLDSAKTGLSAGAKVISGFLDYRAAAASGAIKVRSNGADGSAPAVVFSPAIDIPTSVLYVGAANANAGIYQGNIYSLILRGALSDAAQIAQAEAFVAGKTGVVL